MIGADGGGTETWSLTRQFNWEYIFPLTHNCDILLAAESVKWLLHANLAPVGPRGCVPRHQDHQAVGPDIMGY